MSYNKEIHDSSFKKTRLIYLWYILLAILLFMGIAIVPYCFSLAEEVASNIPLLILVFVPIPIFYAYQGYTMFVSGEMSVSNGTVYYRGYDKGWVPKKRNVEIPISEIQSIGIVQEKFTKTSIEMLCIKTADSSIFINVSSFAKTSMLKALTACMLECRPVLTSARENVTLNLHKPSYYKFYLRYLRVFVNGNEQTFNKEDEVYSFQISTGDVVSVKCYNDFRILRVMQPETIDLMLPDPMARPVR